MEDYFACLYVTILKINFFLYSKGNECILI